MIVAYEEAVALEAVRQEADAKLRQALAKAHALDGNFGLVTFLDPDTRELVQMDVESPDESRATFRHWQQYLAALMIRIGESVDEDERVRRIAKLVGFAHTDELFAHFARTQGLSGEAWWDARRKFPLGIPHNQQLNVRPK